MSSRGQKAADENGGSNWRTIRTHPKGRELENIAQGSISTIKSLILHLHLHNLYFSRTFLLLLKKGRSGVCALWSVTEPSRRRRKVSK